MWAARACGRLGFRACGRLGFAKAKKSAGGGDVYEAFQLSPYGAYAAVGSSAATATGGHDTLSEIRRLPPATATCHLRCYCRRYCHCRTKEDILSEIRRLQAEMSVLEDRVNISNKIMNGDSHPGPLNTEPTPAPHEVKQEEKDK